MNRGSPPPLLLLLLLLASACALGCIADDELEHAAVTYRSFARGLKQAPAPIEGNATANANASSPLLLAASRTERPDPLDHFHTYREGWDIRNKHYWASVGFTGIPGFILALLWAISGILAALFVCCYCCCCSHRKGYHHHHSNLIPLVILFLLSCVAIAGCVWVYYSQAKFHDNLSGTLDFVVQQSHVTVENLQNVSSTLEQGASVQVFNFQVPSDQQQTFRRVAGQLNTTSQNLDTKTKDNAHKIRIVINRMRLAMVIVSAVMLSLVLLGLVFTACGFRSIVYFLVLLGWILVIGTWIICGIFILLNNVMGDTCVAMQEWVRNPNARTNLDDILPCVDQTTANETLERSKELTVSVVNVVNLAVTRILNADNLPAGTAFNVNQSGPHMPTLCTPYGPAPEYDEVPCASGTVSLDDAPGNWSGYVCHDVSNGVCRSTGRMTPDVYANMVKGVSVARGMYINAPFLVNVANCVFVRDTFQTIINERCPGLRKHTRWIWIGLVLVSCGAMLSIFFWIHTSRSLHHRRHEKPIYGT